MDHTDADNNRSTSSDQDQTDNKPDQTDNISSTEPVPKYIIWRIVARCNQLEQTSRGIWHLIKELEQLFPAAGKKYGKDYQANLDLCIQTRVDLEDLIPRLQITGFTLMYNRNSWDKWQEMVRDGFILDFFSESGLNAIILRVEQAVDFAQASTTLIKNDRGDDLVQL